MKFSCLLYFFCKHIVCASVIVTLSTANLSSAEGFEEFNFSPTHPFYIYPSDSPGTRLVSPLFDGSGFVVLRKNILTTLSAKKKLGIITGVVPLPASNSPYFPFYKRCNNMIIAWITNSLSTNLATSVMCFDTAKDIWLDINEHFGQSNGTKYIRIQKEINSTSQGSSSIAAYFTRLRCLWDELHTSYVGPVCTLRSIPSISSFFSSSQSFLCDVFPKSRQHRLSFFI